MLKISSISCRKRCASPEWTTRSSAHIKRVIRAGTRTVGTADDTAIVGNAETYVARPTLSKLPTSIKLKLIGRRTQEDTTSASHAMNIIKVNIKTMEGVAQIRRGGAGSPPCISANGNTKRGDLDASEKAQAQPAGNFSSVRKLDRVISNGLGLVKIMICTELVRQPKR